MQRGMALRVYLAASHLIALIARVALRRRLKRGKEHPERWQEKLGLGLAPRPAGMLVWLHAVGLGEVLSLRGLIERMAHARPDLSFVVTSTTLASADVFGRNAPARTIHQFLPLDAPRYRSRFLDHFKPDLCIWVEQDLWPGLVSDVADRAIPQCMIAARMNATSFQSHQKAESLYRDLYGMMALITAQDRATAAHLSALGAKVRVSGSLKPAAPALSCDPDELATLKRRFADRFVWTVAPAHDVDITIAKEAHAALRKTDPSALLIIAPRFPDQAADDAPKRSAGQVPTKDDPIWLCDTFGELGLVYHLSRAVLIGGTFNDIEGHNPWEAAALSNAIFHGPRTANFRADFAQLADAEAALRVENAKALTAALQGQSLSKLAENATACIVQASQQTDSLAADLLAMIER